MYGKGEKDICATRDMYEINTHYKPKKSRHTKRSKTCIHKITKYMPSGTLGIILFQIEPIAELGKWNSITVLKFIGNFWKDLSKNIWTDP